MSFDFNSKSAFTPNMKIRRLILATFIVGFGSASDVRPNHQNSSKAIVSEVGEPSKLQENFRNLFDSITKNEPKKVEDYRNILEDETVRGHRDFDTLKRELRSARQRNADKQKSFLKKNGNADKKVAVFKRETEGTNDGPESGKDKTPPATNDSSSANAGTTSSIRPVPRAADTFEKIRNFGKVFVDKTPFIRKLIDEDQSQFYFLARPKHFGKSVFLQMLHSFLNGESSRFENTSIYHRGNTKEKDGSWLQHPVIFIDFSKITDGSGSRKELQRELKKELMNIATQNRLTIDAKDIDIVSLIERLESGYKSDWKFHSQPVSILIDNYDAPLTSSTLTEETERELKSFLSQFYERIRACSSKLKLVFVTGVTRLLIGDLFQYYKDLTHDREFTSILGFTAEELNHFGPHIEKYVKMNSSHYNDKKKCLTGFCGWYRFGIDENTTVLNPGLTCKCVGEYALENPMTGTEMTYEIVEEMKRRNIDEKYFKNFSVSVEGVRNGYSCKRREISLHTFMLCNGYLTIKQYDNETNTVVLGYPSDETENEIARAMSGNVDAMTGLGRNIGTGAETPISTDLLRVVRKALAKNDMPVFIELLDHYAFQLRKQPGFRYPIKPADDKLSFTGRIFTVLRSLFKLRSEESIHTTLEGVIDIFTREPVKYVIRVKYEADVVDTIWELVSDMIHGNIIFRRSVGPCSKKVVYLLAINLKYRQDEQRARIADWASVPYRNGNIWINETIASDERYVAAVTDQYDKLPETGARSDHHRLSDGKSFKILSST